MNRHKLLSAALITSLLAIIASRWQQLKQATRSWPSIWKLALAFAGSALITAALLADFDLWQDFISLFTQ